MENTNRIYSDPRVRERLEKLKGYEKDRKFCKHDLDHFLTVGRIATIRAYEEGFEVNRDLIYSAALLHDLGRTEEYEREIPHDRASVAFAKEILKITDFNDEEKERILSMIGAHRGDPKDGYEKIFNEADKLSRACFLCDMREDCYWPEDRKNMMIKY